MRNIDAEIDRALAIGLSLQIRSDAAFGSGDVLTGARFYRAAIEQFLIADSLAQEQARTDPRRWR